MYTIDGTRVNILSDENGDIELILRKNRGITAENERLFFAPDISHLHDPFLMPDMEKAIERILIARENKERIVIFGDYDVDGVSSTALLVRFLTEIGCTVSYRLPHRSRDGYGLKSYVFDELSEKKVTLVITVDCGTRDIEPIRHAKSLGIDVIVTDHHAVPEIIPEEVVALLNPKRKDSQYPFQNLAGSGVAFKLVHGILLTLKGGYSNLGHGLPTNSFSTFGHESTKGITSILMRYIDFASLGTVADCMPLTGENRVITTLGLKQMKNSESAGLRKFFGDAEEKRDSQKRSNSNENRATKGNVQNQYGEGGEKIGIGKTSFSESLDADIIGFQIGPRINASGRMDTPLTALRWLLASEDRCDEFLGEIEELNSKRQEIVKTFAEKALGAANPQDGILFYRDAELEHGLIGLVAGKLTEAYNRPSIVLCEQHDAGEKQLLVASCRSPEWCHLVELLDECREYFIRYGGHRQAAGFTIEASRYADFQSAIGQKFREKYGEQDCLPPKSITVECEFDSRDVNITTYEMMEKFKPFGIGNKKPIFLIKNLTILDARPLGQSGQHMSFTCVEIPSVRFLAWRVESALQKELQRGNIISPIIELGRNEWNGKISIQCTLISILSND